MADIAVDQEKLVQCGLCISLCDWHVLDMDDDDTRVIATRPMDCTSCMLCQSSAMRRRSRSTPPKTQRDADSLRPARVTIEVAKRWPSSMVGRWNPSRAVLPGTLNRNGPCRTAAYAKRLSTLVKAGGTQVALVRYAVGVHHQCTVWAGRQACLAS